jgi:hypothetical protein
MILESTVAANVAQNNTVLNLNDFDTVYGYCTKKNTRTYFTQEEVERELTNNGCKFLRLDDSELNVENQWLNNQKISFIYDWTYEKYISGCYEQMEGNVWFKRFWLVMK